MSKITTTGGSLILDGRSSVPKGEFSLKIRDDNEDILVLTYSSVSWTLNYLNTTVDDESFEDPKLLLEKLSSFSKGGGDGQGVTWDDVQDKPLKTLDIPIADAEGLVPVYTQDGQLPVGTPEFPENAVPLALLDNRAPDLTEGNFLVGGSEGNTQRKILPSDFNLTTSNGFATKKPGENQWEQRRIDTNASNSSVVLRTSTGQGRFNPAINNDEAVVLSQLNTATQGVDLTEVLGYDVAKTQRLVHVQGVLQWEDEV